MSRLPQAERAYVEDVKVRDYLLNPVNPKNRGKAGLFSRFGFTRENWELLAAALRQHALMNEVDAMKISPHGVKYVVKCNLLTPDHRNPCLTSVWMSGDSAAPPRLLTAY